MKKSFFLLICFCCLFKVHAQIRFEPGYIIKNDDEKIDVFIKNIDWKNTPKKVEYKITQDSESITADVNTIKEFSINNSDTYRRFKVNIDRSSDVLRSLSSTKNPIFTEEEVFLKSLVEGDASLYYYEDENLRRYFFKVDNSDVEQLINKSYITPNNKVERNETYKQQLWLKLKYDKITIQLLEKTGYNDKDLKNIFYKYNYRNGGGPEMEKETPTKIKRKNPFHIAIRPGINFSSMTLNRLKPYGFADFGSKTTYRLGIENEYTLPFHKNKWSIIIEPTYQYFSSESELVRLYLPEKEEVKVEYKSIEVPLGVRHYFFLNENNRFFLNSQLIYDIAYNSRYVLESSGTKSIQDGYNFVFGGGFKSRKISLEARYNLTRNNLSGHTNWSSRYKSYGFVLGYNIF